MRSITTSIPSRKSKNCELCAQEMERLRKALEDALDSGSQAWEIIKKQSAEIERLRKFHEAVKLADDEPFAKGFVDVVLAALEEYDA